MPDFRYALDADRLAPGETIPVQIDDRWYAVANDRGTFYACEQHCPHEGGPLGKGEVHDGCIVCPVHHWPWNLKTGLTDPNMPWMHLTLFACRVREGRVEIDVEAPIPPDYARQDRD